MQIRDRIKDFRRVQAQQLRPHPRNWRTHPQAQQDAMRGVLAEIGYADALLGSRTGGRLAATGRWAPAREIAPDALVPVLVLDLDDEEALKLLATLDPLAAMAGTDADVLAGLVADVETNNQAVRAMLDQLVADNPAVASQDSASQGMIIPETFQVVVECRDELEQRGVFERLSAEGFKCRVLSL